MTRNRIIRVAWLVGLVGLLAGCPKAPIKLLKKAKSTIDGLDLAKKCAPEAYRSAVKMYKEAIELNKKKAYKQARRAAEAAVKLAEKAKKQAEANRKDCEKIAAADKRPGDKSPTENPDKLPSGEKPGDLPGPDRPPTGPVKEQLVIYFGYNKFTIDPESAKKLTEFAAKHKDATSASLEVEGHCDARGSVEYNLALGERRAKAARDFLVTQGMSGRNISIISYGSEKPQDDRSVEEAYSKNRRAVIKLR